jgi:hypothetical protein
MVTLSASKPKLNPENPLHQALMRWGSLLESERSHA